MITAAPKITIPTRNFLLEVRAWDIEKKEYKNVELFGNSMPSNWVLWYLLEVFVGLKDTNKRKVFQHDIVKFHGETMVVMWDEVQLGFYLVYACGYRHDWNSTSKSNGYTCQRITRSKKLTVIGNLRENPELLNT